jgi:hypothetical protein
VYTEENPDLKCLEASLLQRRVAPESIRSAWVTQGIDDKMEALDEGITVGASSTARESLQGEKKDEELQEFI